MSGTLGSALRHIGGGPVEVMLRVADFALRVDAKQGVGGSGAELVAFMANDYREIDNGDVWEFSVVEASEGGAASRTLRVFVCGSDLLMVRAVSALR